MLIGEFILFLSGCSASRIPVSYRFNPGALKREITGCWTEVNLNLKNITNPEKALSGELIAIQSDTMYILTGTGLEGIRTSQIYEAVLYMYGNMSGKFAIVTALLYLPDIVAAMVIGEPAFLALGIPWILTGSILSVAEGSNHSNLLNYPYNCQLQELKKFARFPQGMPRGIDKSRLHLITGR